MNGEDLVYDWKYNVVDEPTEWAFNWDYGDCGTAHPQPKEHHATMYIILNQEFPLAHLRQVMERSSKLNHFKFEEIINQDDEEEEESVFEEDYMVKFELKEKGVCGQTLLKGSVDTNFAKDMDPNVGAYAVLESTTPKGFALAQRMKAQAYFGSIAIIPHERIEKQVCPDYKVISETGNEDGGRGLATRFQLWHMSKEEEVARCLLTTRDGSWDSSIGPTLEMIAVKQSRRGEGLAKFLWYHVRRYIEEHWTLECLNSDVPQGLVMVKATQVLTNEVEIRLDKDNTPHPMTMKELLYDYFGFSVREQQGIVAQLLGRRRIKDEEAVLYIPLLKPGTTSPMKEPTPGKAIYREKIGKRMCHWCSNLGMDLLRCSRCGIAYYCSKRCQKSDWKRHKKWCCKTREEVRKLMIQEGHMIVNEDGTGSILVNGPNRTLK